jgi:hypothetical protein
MNQSHQSPFGPRLTMIAAWLNRGVTVVAAGAAVHFGRLWVDGAPERYAGYPRAPFFLALALLLIAAGGMLQKRPALQITALALGFIFAVAGIAVQV